MPARQRTTADIFAASQEWLFQATKYFQPNRVHSFVKGEILPKVRFKTPPAFGMPLRDGSTNR